MKSSRVLRARPLRGHALAPAAASAAFPTSLERYEACPSIPPSSMPTALQLRAIMLTLPQKSRKFKARVSSLRGPLHSLRRQDDEALEVQRGADCLCAAAGGEGDPRRRCLPAA